MPPSQNYQQNEGKRYALPSTLAPMTLALLSFDAALFVVSNHLAEARIAWDGGETGQAQTWFETAEACALQSGYIELVQLVWSDPDNAAPNKTSAHFAPRLPLSPQP